MEQRADIMFTGGRIWPGVERRGPLDTVAVRGGRIVGMGDAADLEWARGPRTRVIPLGGRLLVPAFGDAHAHPLLAGLGMSRCWLTDEPEDVEAYLSVVRAYATRATRSCPGWSARAGRRVPSRAAWRPPELLDAVVPDRPVFLLSADGYAAWVNSRALELAGIGPETPDPEGGRIERDADGAPLGTLQGRALDLVERLTPPTTAQEREEGLRRGQAFLQRVGIGSWQDANVDPDEQAAYLALAGRGELTGRAALALLLGPGPGSVAGARARRPTAGRWRTRGPAGCGHPPSRSSRTASSRTRTAAMLEPYLDAHGQPRHDRGDSTLRGRRPA